MSKLLRIGLCGLSVLFASALAQAIPYTTKDCVSCHTPESAAWSTSDHAHAMAIATPQSVLGNFDKQSVEYYAQRATFFIDADKVKATIIDTTDDSAQTFTIKYSFGHEPLQQYLVETEPGRLQVLPFAWDSRSKSDGGQRWYHNFDAQNKNHSTEVSVNDRLHWRQPLQNWNGMCADCHSDEVKRQYNSLDNSFNTTFSHISVGCVSCHGAMPEHQQANSKLTADKPLSQNSKINPISHYLTMPSHTNYWAFTPQSPNAVWKAEPRDNGFMQTCYACHSLRAPLTDGFTAGTAFLDQFSPTLVTPPSYYPDGQIKEEVFVYGSFLQSKMHAKGVNCLDCHDSHTMKVKAQGNGLCLQCHKATVYETQQHHNHETNSQAAQCVSCHMPATTYMGVDSRRDHSFKVPRPDLSSQFDTPNACIDCHQEKSNQWASDAITKWRSDSELLLSKKSGSNPKPNEFDTDKSSVNRHNLLKLRHQQSLSVPLVIEIASDQAISVIDRASAIAMLAQTQSSLNARDLVGFVEHVDPLIRLATARASERVPAHHRADLVLPLLSDELRAVRVAAANSLIGVPIDPGNVQAFAKAFGELQVANNNIAWRGEGRINQGNIQLADNNLFAAELSYKASVTIDPFFAPGYMNLADVYRAKMREDLVADLLHDGMQKVPFSADLAYAFGLHLIRIKKISLSVSSFAQAMRLDDSNAQFAYTYILALDGTGKSEQALRELRALSPHYQYDAQLIELGLYIAKKLQREDDFRWFERFRL